MSNWKSVEVAITKVATRCVKFASTTATVAEKRRMVKLLHDTAQELESIIEEDRKALLGIESNTPETAIQKSSQKGVY